ncbi:MAG: tol-pal system-associated acyl-CoA thioesterase [Steroidobacteraceae bacterium]
MSFTWPARVYWEDTDGGGVVYHGSYLKFFERARTEWLRSLGISQRALADEQSILFTVASLEIRFRHPARLDDELRVSCEAARAGGASIGFVQRIHRRGGPGGGQDALRQDVLIAEAEVRVACLDARTLRPQRLPEFMVDLLGTRLEERA